MRRKTSVQAAHRSERGRCRPENHDVVLSADSAFVVCDGNDQHSDGAVAAALAARAFVDDARHISNFGGQGYGTVIMRTAVQKAAIAIAEACSQGRDQKGMATTLTGVAIDEDRLYVAHLGDSRAYLLRNQKLTQLTTDHTFGDQMFRAGMIDSGQLRKSRFRNVLSRAIRVDERHQPDISEFALRHDDRILLCTHGIYRELDDNDRLRWLASHGTVQECVQSLVEHADNAGGRDNLSAVLIKFNMIREGRNFSLRRIREFVSSRIGSGQRIVGLAASHQRVGSLHGEN